MERRALFRAGGTPIAGAPVSSLERFVLCAQPNRRLAETMMQVLVCAVRQQLPSSHARRWLLTQMPLHACSVTRHRSTHSLLLQPLDKLQSLSGRCAPACGKLLLVRLSSKVCLKPAERTGHADAGHGTAQVIGSALLAWPALPVGRRGPQLAITSKQRYRCTSVFRARPSRWLRSAIRAMRSQPLLASRSRTCSTQRNVRAKGSQHSSRST